MKTIWLLGWMSWESTLEYYRIINTEIQKSLWWHHSGKILLYSVDFDDIKNLQFEGKWKEAWEKLWWYAQVLERSGADIILIATNTMHKVYEEVASSVQIPIMHIADGTGKKIQESGYKKVGLLWTRFTMEQDFYKQRLEEKYWLSILIPDSDDRWTIHSIIYDELCLGVINEPSRKKYENIIEKLKSHGAECIILWCTEIWMLIQENNSPLPVFDTTYIHAKGAVEYALT
jgi:aspartate racemase